MTKIKSTLFLFAICLIQLIYAQPQKVEIGQNGRRIQLDGFLLEWNEQSAKKIGRIDSSFWDAINTPEGIAGYFRFTKRKECFPVKIHIYKKISDIYRYVEITTDSEATWYKVFEDTNKDTIESTTIIEYVIPWDSLRLDSLGRYEVGISGFSHCNDIQSPIILSGKRYTNQSIMTPRLISQLIIVGLLLVLYMWFQARVRKMQKRTRKPFSHQG